MIRRVVLRTQQNEVFQAIQDSSLSPGDFCWKEEKSKYLRDSLISTVIHNPSKYYSKFDWIDTSAGPRPYIECSPGTSTPLESGRTNENFPIHTVRKWLTNLKREVEAPDLWGAILSERALIEGISAYEGNAQFSQDEQLKIGATLNEIKSYLERLQNFTDQQRSFIESNFNYLIDAASRVGRKDWVIILLGTLVSTAVSLAITPDNTHALLRFAGQMIRQLLSGIISIPLIR